MGEEKLNKTYGDGPEGQTQSSQPINMLAVPRAWTRLVVALCILLFVVVGLVSLIVFFTYNTSRDNINRLMKHDRQICETRLKVGLDCDPPPTPTPQEEQK